MKCLLKIWIESDKEASAKRVSNRILRKLGTGQFIMLEPYHKGGFVARYEIPVMASDWPNAVLEVLQFTQGFARGRVLNGSIENELDLISNELFISGATMAHLTLSRKS